MENIFARLYRLRDERNRIAELGYEVEHVREMYEKSIAIAKLDSPEKYQQEIAAFWSELDISEQEISKLQTIRLLRRSRRWGVPVPDRPQGTDENEYWEHCHSVGGHALNVNGQKLLRREIAEEYELYSKPILAWAAIAISVISLVLSVLSAIF